MNDKELKNAKIAYYIRNIELLKKAIEAQKSNVSFGASLKPSTIIDNIPCETIGIPGLCMEEIMKIALEKSQELLKEQKGEK